MRTECEAPITAPKQYIVVVIWLAAVMLAHTAVWYVHPDSTLSSIQNGLNLCATNDTVLVGSGIYYESLIWPNTQGIDLRSEYGADATIIHRAGNGYSTIELSVSVDSTTIIDGFTIRNASSGTLWQGAILCISQASPLISNNIITENICSGISCEDSSSPIISSNHITDNITWGIFGAGINCSNSSPTIIDNLIDYNEVDAISFACGGGIYCWHSSPLIAGNTITHNSTAAGIPGTTQGGGICLVNSAALITRNTITMNYANQGGGIFCTGWGTSPPLPSIMHNDIIQNHHHAIYNANTNTIVDAEENWWGHFTGPFHPILNPGGLGDSVGDFIDFDPWLTDPVGVTEEHHYVDISKQKTIGATIISGPPQLPENKECLIYDITGRIVTINTMPPGIYFLKVDGQLQGKYIKVR